MPATGAERAREIEQDTGGINMEQRRRTWEPGLPPLREWWQEINRQERQAQAELRAKRKARDKKRSR